MLVFVICVEAIIYLLLYNLHDCAFNNNDNENMKVAMFNEKITVICR